MLPLRARVDLGAMAMKGYSTFPKAPALQDLTIRFFSVISRTLVVGGGLPLCRGAVSVFYSPSRLGKILFFSANVTRDFLISILFLICKLRDCTSAAGIKVDEFKLQSWYYIHFSKYFLWKEMDRLFLQSNWLNTITADLLRGWLWL